MFSNEDICNFCGQWAFERAHRFPRNLLDTLNIQQNSKNGKVEIQAVFNYRYFAGHTVRILLTKDMNKILDARCSCSNSRYYYEHCDHTAYVLLEIFRKKNSFIYRNGKWILIKETDFAIRDLLGLMTNVPQTSDKNDTVRLIPVITDVDADHSVQVDFRIADGKGRPYIVRSIGELMSALKSGESIRFGKNLDFVPDINSFQTPYRPLVEFLLSLEADDDHYTPAKQIEYGRYYTPAHKLNRVLTLKGRYLDMFMKLIENIPFQFALTMNPSSKPFSTCISEDLYEMEVKFKKEEFGCRFSGPHLLFGEGYEYLYFFDIIKNTVYRNRRQESLLPILEYFSENPEEERFISNADLPAFSRYIYPVLSKSMHIKNNGYDPYEYLPPRPKFQIYLDLPQDNLLTGELYALYKEKQHNLLNDTDTKGSRDEEEEKRMRDFFCPWFNSADPVNHRMAIIDDEDKMYTFLTEGIPAMQKKGEVFISDRLKKLTVNNMPKVQVGISVSGDLLQLDLFSASLSPAQLSEIMSRYNRKKKYYRLKSGEFLNIDKSLEELDVLADTLSLTAKDIAKGTVELPLYRALSLENMEEDTDLEFHETENYRKLVQKMKNAENMNISIPEDLHAILRPYQETGFRWLCALHTNGFGALLSDEMGLGKTVQAIAFLGTLKGKGRKLIVCPASLVYNWGMEIERFMPSLSFRMITGNAAQRKHLITDSNEDDVLITSYDLLKRDLEIYEPYSFACQIIDEAQYIKNAGTQASIAVKSIRSSFRIAMTGTPIENRLSELWSIFDYLLPGFFHSYKWFRDHFEAPIIKEEHTGTEERLKKMISPFVLRRLKKEVLKDLPDKLEEVRYAPLEGEQKELYEARVQRLKMMLSKQSAQEFKESKIEVLAELTRLRQICCDPSLLYENYRSNSSKKEVCLDLIRNAVESGHKVLLFSQFTSMLDELTFFLDKEGIAYHLLTGNTKKEERNRMVKAFASDNVPVFCISLKAGGTGLNLTAADIVIHYDPWWNTAVEQQASDRAHRIGQKNVVTVYRLIMKDTIEERILKLQEDKSSLSDRILSAEGISASSLSREDLLNLL